MCGIAGTFGFQVETGKSLVSDMCNDMVPRGPDDGGVIGLSGDGVSVVLGNRRLAIIDPSPAGHQPMVDAESEIVVVFNGMIYNFAQLREELAAQGHRFDSHSDTEVVLRAYRHYGRDFLRRLRGMFALAVWDGRRNELFLARDRLGIKPLYIHERDGRIAFASQVKALLAAGIAPVRLSPAGVESYLATGAVSDPLTIIDGVRSLPPGHCATVTSRGLSIERWWDFPATADLTVSREEATEEILERLRESVALHLVSDAPVGVFLSGGLDSSLIASLAVERHAAVRTVSVTFDEKDFSEERYISSVVKQLGTDHIDVRLGVDELLTWSHEAFSAMDQPSYDGINTFAVSRAASMSGLKVALSGLGADELFNGYGFAQRIPQLARLKRIPRPLAAALGSALGAAPGSRGLKPSAWLRGELDRESGYELLRRAFLPGEIRELMPGHDGQNVGGRPKQIRAGHTLSRDLAVAEMSSYMSNVLLRDADAMSMSQSLEVRVPFLDDHLTDWSLRLPVGAKGLAPKALLRNVAADRVPPEVLARHKQGFVLPLGRWMHHDLRGRMDDLFGSPPSALEGVLDKQAVLGTWRRYLRDAPAPLVSAEEWLRPWSLYALHEWIAAAESASARAPAVL